MRVLAIPEDDAWLGDRFFDPPAGVRDNALEPFRYLREFLGARGVRISTFDMGDLAQADRIVFFELKRFAPLFLSLDVTRLEQRVLVIWEPPAVCPINYDSDLHSLFGTVLTWNDALVDGEKYRKLQFPVPRHPEPKPTPFPEMKLLATIVSSKASRHRDSLYGERIRAIRYFERRCPDEFDFYGMGWHEPTTVWQRLHLARVPRFPSYRGTVRSKLETLSRYRFALCYENMRSRSGYVTEKIFDAMQAGTVPVYLGAENVNRYVWPGTFVDARQFEDYDRLYEHLAGMGEAEHERHLIRIKEFLESDSFAQFLPERFAQTVHHALVSPAEAHASDPAAVGRARRKVEARYLAEESRRAFAAGRASEYRRMFRKLLRISPRLALGSPGLVARYPASLIGMSGTRRQP